MNDSAPSALHAYDEGAEIATLGAMLISSSACEEVTALVDSEDYYVPRNRLVYDAIFSQHVQGLPTDQIAISDALAREGTLSKAGGPEYLQHLEASVVTASNADYYARIVSRQSARRKVAATGARLMQIADASDELVVIEDAYRLLEQNLSVKLSSSVSFVADILPGLLDSLAETGTTLFHPSPWPSLDDVIGGFRPGGLYVVAARPAQGKTIVAMQIAAALAERGNVAFSNLEMSGEELVARLISERLAIMVGKVKDRRLTPKDWDVIAAGRQRLNELRIAIDDRPSVSMHDVRQHARTVSRRPGGLSGIVIDYLQLMDSRDDRPRHEKVAQFSREAKVMAKELQVPVILLSQLNRKVEDRADGLPRLGDLRESGAIEQDADAVFLLRRETGGGRLGPNGIRPEGFVIHVAKNRHGEEREVELAWQGEFSRVVEYDSY